MYMLISLRKHIKTNKYIEQVDNKYSGAMSVTL